MILVDAVDTQGAVIGPGGNIGSHDIGQSPPQSTPVSVPFCLLSVQVDCVFLQVERLIKIKDPTTMLQKPFIAFII
jgi:hypothetical protein